MGGGDQERRHQGRLTRQSHRECLYLCHRRRYRRHLHRSRRLRCRYRRSRLHQEPDDLWSAGRGHLRLHPQGCARCARRDLRQARHHARHQRAVAARGSKTALLTTAGFRDVLEIGRGNRTQPFNLRFHREPPLIPRELRFEIAERVEGVREGAHAARDRRRSARSPTACARTRSRPLAISFLNAYLDPDARAGRRARAAPPAAGRVRHHRLRADPRMARVRAHRDRGRQRLCGAAGQPIHRRVRRANCAAADSRARCC